MKDAEFKETKHVGRQDWQLTSTGVGHHYRPGYYFPHDTFKTVIREPLPPDLAAPKEVKPPHDHETTTGFFHDGKWPDQVYNNHLHKKAPGHWKVHYNKDLAEKLGSGGWRKPLTMGNQKSEMQDKYRAEPLMPRDGYKFDEYYIPQNYLLQDHHKEGPTKYGQGATENPKLKGQPWYVKDKGVLRELDPYLSTTQKVHRRFMPDEQNGYPKKNIATYWDCEEYPKTYGHGNKPNLLPKDSVPRDKLPMRDTMVFPTATKIPRLPKSFKPVPHNGLKSLYDESFQIPTHVNLKENDFKPVDTPYTLPAPGTKSICTAPKMYTTEYQHIGSRKPVIV